MIKIVFAKQGESKTVDVIGHVGSTCSMAAEPFIKNAGELIHQETKAEMYEQPLQTKELQQGQQGESV